MLELLRSRIFAQDVESPWVESSLRSSSTSPSGSNLELNRLGQNQGIIPVTDKRVRQANFWT